MNIAIRTTSEMGETTSLLRGTLASAAPNVPITEFRTMPTLVSEATSTSASTTLLFVCFAGVAHVLGIIGVYGVLSYLVSRRRRELGVRMALGAQRGDVLWLVMKEGAKFAASGIALGLTGSFSVACSQASSTVSARWMPSPMSASPFWLRS